LSARRHGAVRLRGVTVTPDDERFTPADELPIDLWERTRGLVDAAEIITKYAVFWIAGRSNDGRRVFKDYEVPKFVAGIDTDRSLAVHELGEWICMNEGETYDKMSKPPGCAHYHANGLEKIEVERQGGVWEEYCIAFRPFLKETDEVTEVEEGVDHPPVEDWDLRPVQDDDPELIAELFNKSTFSAPASSTSGMQGYDLEGAVRRRKDKRKNRKAAAMNDFTMFIPITKYDAKKRLAYGTIAAEVPDKTNEIMDYESSVPQFKLWSDEISKASDGKSVGNVRIMHQAVVGGKMTEINYDDDSKRITGIAKVLSDEAHRLIEEGALTGFSIGGGYAKRWKDPDDDSLMRYTPRIAEVSFVDNPCIPGATFEYVKMDGTVEQRMFKKKGETTAPAEGNDDQAQPRGASVRTHEGRSGFDDDEGDTDTVLADASHPKAGAKAPKVKDDGAAQNRHAKPKPDSAKEQSAVESTVHYKTPTASDIANHAVDLAKAAGKAETDWAQFVTQARTELEKKTGAKDIDARGASDDSKKAKKEGEVEEGKEGGKNDAKGTGDKKTGKTLAFEVDSVVDTATHDAEETQVWVHPKLPGKTFTRKADMRAALVQSEADAVADKAAAPAKDLLDQIDKVLNPEKFVEAEALQKPWASNTALPKSVQHLPDEAKTVFRTAANGHLKSHAGDDEGAMKVGWTAVKNGWEKKGDSWIKKSTPDSEQPYWLVKREYSPAAREKYAKEGVAMKDGSFPIPDKGALKDAIQAHGRSKNKGAAKRHIVRRAKALGASDMLPDTWKAVSVQKTANFSTMQGLMGLLSYAEQFEEMLESEPEAYELVFSSGSTSITVSKDICDRFGKLLGELGDIAADILDDLLNAMKDEEREEANKLAGVIVQLNKLGARNSKSDKEIIKSAHDLMARLEPSSCPAAEKLHGSEEMVKMSAAVEKAIAERDSFDKQLVSVTETLADMMKSIKKIEGADSQRVTPAVGPNGERRYSVMEKSADMGSIAPPTGDGYGDAAADVEKLLQHPDVLKVLAESALRAAHRSPMTEIPGLSVGHEKR
jgi:phage head maturation protease/cation transport regulator ChaB